jgi:glycosyltransferase involved in cell wall biosynthesis/predicted O-methyltransferase YrrM
MDDSAALFAKVIAAYEAEGFPHEIIGQWTLPENDAADLIELVRKYQPKRILEVGTFVGVSTMLIALVAGEDARVVSIDPGFPLEVEMSSMGSRFGNVDPAMRTHDVARAVARRLGLANRIDFIAGGFASGATFASRRTSTQTSVPVVGPTVCGERGPFDVVFIDGLHYADVVEADLELACHYTSANGVVLVHDCIGMWGSNVRCGVFRFLSKRPDWKFLHAPFQTLYRSIGLVFRSTGSPDLLAQLLDRPCISPYLAGLLPPLASSLTEHLCPRGVIEIAVGEALLAPHFKNVESCEAVLIEGNWTQSLEARVHGLLARGIDPANILITTAGALDVVDDDAFARVLALIGDHGIVGAFMRTPPGERNAACRFSRPLRRWVAMAMASGVQVREMSPFDLAPSRFLFLKGAERTPTSSSLCDIVVISSASASAFESLETFPMLSEKQADAIEQAELLHIHYSAGLQRLFLDNAIINQRNVEIAQQQTMAEQRALSRRSWPYFPIARLFGRPTFGLAPIRDIEDALAHASRRGRSNPIVVLNCDLSNELVQVLLADPRIGGVGVKSSRDGVLVAQQSSNPRIGFYYHHDRQWKLPQGSKTVYFAAPVRLLSRSMLEAAWRAGVTHLYAQADTFWLRIPLQQLHHAAMHARRVIIRLAICRSAVVTKLAKSRWRGYFPGFLRLMSYDEGFATALRDANPRSDYIPRRVVVVCGSLAPGGAERQVANTLIGLSRFGLKDTWFLAHHLQDGPGRLNFHLPRVRAADIPAREIRRVMKSATDPAMPKALREAAPAFSANLVLDIANLVEEFLRLRPQVVHTWLDWDNVRAGLAAAIAGVPRIVISGRNLAPYHFKLYQSYMDAAYRALARLPQVHFINNSQAGADNYAEWIGIPPERIQVIYNGLDSGDRQRLSETERAQAREKLGIPPDSFVVGGMFRFDEEKRPFLWLEVASRLAAVSKQVRFILHGQGPLLEAMAERIAALGLGNLVVVAGVTDDPFNAISLMDVLLLTSRDEGLPNVVIEAQSVGTAVVCTKAGGSPEALNPGKSGWVVDSDDPAEVANTVANLISNPKALTTALEQGPAFVRLKFGVDRMIAETLQAYALEPT